MTCTDYNIKDMIPDFLENKLSPDMRRYIDSHLAQCDDCSKEVALLRNMAEDPVPDPGEAFWNGLPDRIRRQVRQAERIVSRGVFARTFEHLRVLRWTLAPAVVVLAVIGALVFRNMTGHGAAQAPTGENVTYELLLPEERTLNIAELDAPELNAVVHWADRELALLIDTADYGTAVFDGADLEEELRLLDARQLSELSESLRQKSQEV